jgi:soluble lytic murein transglycosylase-like protein
MAPYAPFTVYECARQGAPIDFVINLMRGESSFDPLARGPTNTDGSFDFGPMQLNSNHYYPGMTIYENISCGIAHIMVEYRRFGNNVLAVWAYNAGPSKVGKRLPDATYGLLSRVFGKSVADKVKARLRRKG